MTTPFRSVLFLSAVSALPIAEAGASLDDAGFSAAIDALRAVGPEAAGNEEAAAAWGRVSAEPPSSIPSILDAMEGANPLAANWLAAAADAIADRAAEAGDAFPVAELGELILDAGGDPRARALGFRLLEECAPETAAVLVPGFLSDPSNPLRRRAVERLANEGAALREAEKNDAAAVVFRQALNAARDVDQVTALAKALENLGQATDLPRHFGFLMRWKVAGPFDNTDLAGFERAYPPEAGIQLDATYEGKDGVEVAWQDYATSDDFGLVDFNQPLQPLKGVCAYAFHEFVADSARPAELRLGTKNAWKVWFNGDFVFGREEYHRGMEIDQYRMPIQLREGSNAILVKLCQNEEVQDWTVQWEFQLRVCDASGAAILSADREATPTANETSTRRSRRRPAK